MKRLNIYGAFFLIIPLMIGCKVGNRTESYKLSKADQYMAIHIYRHALPIYLDNLKGEPENADLNLKAGICYLKTSQCSEAIPYLEKAIHAGKAPAYFYMGQALHAEDSLNEALENYLKFKKNISYEEYFDYKVDRYIEITERAIRMKKEPVNVTIANLGPSVNSPYADYVPVINADESVLIFTSRREGSTGGIKDNQGKYYEDLYVTHKGDTGWEPPVQIAGPVNTDLHDACVGLSADGQKMLLYRMDEEFYGGDLYISDLSGELWGAPKKIGGHVNSAYWEPSGSLSADEKILFFSSNRPGGYGGNDIYMTKKLPDGAWGVPVNVGPIINTEYDEDAPFIHPDGRTLYFSSRGHQTMGGFDIFKSVLQEEDMWSLPENIGYPINTVGDDIYFVLSADGKRGYYASDKEGGIGEKDIYVIHMPEENVPLTVIKGQILSEENNHPLTAVVTVINTNTREVQGIYRSNSLTGKYIIVLPADINFKAVVEAKGYHSFSQELELNSSDQFKEINKDFMLQAE